MKYKKKKYSLLFVVGLVGVTFLGGMIIGMVFQQMIFTASAVEFGESLEGVTVNVDLNETVLVDKFKEVFITLFNQTIQENKNGE